MSPIKIVSATLAGVAFATAFYKLGSNVRAYKIAKARTHELECERQKMQNEFNELITTFDTASKEFKKAHQARMDAARLKFQDAITAGKDIGSELLLEIESIKEALKKLPE